MHCQHMNRIEHQPPDRSRHVLAAALIAATLATPTLASAQTTVTIGIGTQDTTTNTVTTGVVIRQLKLLEKYLPKDGKYAGIKFELDWQNFTSGPPVTNGMMANKLQFGAMGDYPLVVNGFTFENNPESKSRLIAVAAAGITGGREAEQRIGPVPHRQNLLAVECAHAFQIRCSGPSVAGR